MASIGLPEFSGPVSGGRLLLSLTGLGTGVFALIQQCLVYVSTTIRCGKTMNLSNLLFTPPSNATGSSSSTINGAELIRRDFVSWVAANNSGCVIRNVD